jgi:DDE superfamily endonuclease
MVLYQLPADVSRWVEQLSGLLHQRVAARLLPVLLGCLFSRGRRTVASWFRAADVGDDFRAHYYFLGSLGRCVRSVAMQLVWIVVRVLCPGERLLFALDDTPTKRNGPCVEGAGIHHNPTPGRAGQKFLYGHIWVTLSLVAHHPLWGAIGLPLLGLLYVRAKDIPALPSWYKVRFQTKLQLAAQLFEWLAFCLHFLGKTVWIVCDGAYAKRPVLQAAAQFGFVVVSRLRKDAALFTLPEPERPNAKKRRGPKPKYGKQAIALAKRAGHNQGWLTGTFVLYGKEVVKTYKTFLATYAVAGGVIRVVLVRETDGWVAYFCTDPNATVAQILEAVADRATIEQDFHDLKEVHGLGQQQLRHYFANIGAFHIIAWLHTLVELWAWDQPKSRLCDRRDRPWDNAERRPSHADRCKSLRRLCLEQQIEAAQTGPPIGRKLLSLLRRLVRLAV